MSQNTQNRTVLQPLNQFHHTYSVKPRIYAPHSDELITKQSFRNECNINTLMAKYYNTGEMPVLNLQAPQYLDTTGVDYQEAMQFVAGANSLFQELPSSIRNRFQNDPAQFLDFTSRKENIPEMEQMGLLRPDYKAPEAPTTTPPQTPPEPPKIPV